MRPIIAGFLAWSLLGAGLAAAQIPGTGDGVPLDTSPNRVPGPTPVVPPNPIGTNPVTIRNPNESPIPTPISDPLDNPLDTPDVTNVGRMFPRPSKGQNPNQNQDQGPTQFRVFVGTYTNSQSQSEGIYSFVFDTKDGSLSNQSTAAKLANPSFVALHPSLKFLYAVSEVGKFAGKSSGSVSAYAIDAKSGMLSLLNTEPSNGADPCYLTVDAAGSAVLVANYTGGSVTVLPLTPDGKLGAPTQTIRHEGSGPNQARQAGAHAHSVDFDPTNRVVVVADLGLDKLMLYRFDPKTATLRAHVPNYASLPPGSGPRHVAFAPDGRHAYVINEMGSSITDFDYNRARGAFSALQTTSTRPAGSPGGNATAEILVHPSGRFVYGSNRGDDSLAIYTVDAASGKLTPAGFQATGGKTPRNFEIDPTGQFLLVGNQDSNTITVFRIDATTGQLSPAGGPIPCPAPVCIRFAPLGQ